MMFETALGAIHLAVSAMVNGLCCHCNSYYRMNEEHRCRNEDPAVISTGSHRCHCKACCHCKCCYHCRCKCHCQCRCHKPYCVPGMLRTNGGPGTIEAQPDANANANADRRQKLMAQKAGAAAALAGNAADHGRRSHRGPCFDFWAGPIEIATKPQTHRLANRCRHQASPAAAMDESNERIRPPNSVSIPKPPTETIHSPSDGLSLSLQDEAGLEDIRIE
ncbi:unnamed protein product [Pseudo-nitzschia multistriata]|uniref:Secreted protein n=1 Tax=Pseudo-nitzschia multistriata TaxID=183589 RepID=A0A448ZBI8_9STRA|nr:unnamed protein product [Pseudo-nitzschia multistriata]